MKKKIAVPGPTGPKGAKMAAARREMADPSGASGSTGVSDFAVPANSVEAMASMDSADAPGPAASTVRGGSATAPMALDALDLRLLALLQEDGRASNARLAEALHVSETACWRRMRRLEAAGCVTGYRADVSRAAIGLGVLALVQIGFASHSGDSPERFEDAVRAIPEILSCRNVTGEADYVLEVVARDLPAYGRFVAEVLRRLPGVATVRSSLCLREVKAGARLPVGVPPGR